MTTFTKARLSSLALGGLAAGALVSWAVMRYVSNRSRRKPSYKIGNTIHIINKAEEWDRVYHELMEDIKVVKVLGLDCEWVQKKPVALLQLSTPTGLCVLVRLFKLGSSIPKTLKSLLADKSILKVGVAVLDDGKKLFQDYGIHVNGCVDLRHVLKRVRGVFHCTSRGLRGLASGVLDVDISKDASIRCGNWEADQYSQEQIDYAATDAAVAVDIFVQIVYAKIAQSTQASSYKMKHKNAETIMSKSLDQGGATPNEESSRIPDLSALSTSVVDDETAVCDSLSRKDNDNASIAFSKVVPMPSNAVVPTQNEACQVPSPSQPGLTSLQNRVSNYKYPDVFHMQDSHRDSTDEKELQEFWSTARSLCQGIVEAPYNYKGDNKGVAPPPKANEKLKDSTACSVRKKPLWDNCRLEAPDGTMLCTCDTRKAQWYLDKELGDKICDDPLTVRLRFEPSRRPQEEMNFYKQEKQNICVVCGHDKDYVRKFVIPYEYRKYLPFALKDHSSHDILLLCTSCHRRSCDFDAQLRLLLAQECGAPVESGPASKVMLDHDMQKIRSAGRALKLNRASIPEDRVTQLEGVLCSHFEVKELTDDLIEEAAEVDARLMSSDYVPHAKRVVRHMRSNGGLLAFQARWRQHFVSTMNPQYLPQFWRVDFVPEGWTYSQEESEA